MSACPPQPTLEGLIAGTLPVEEATRVEEHVTACPECGRRLADTTQDEELLASVRTALAGSPSPDLPDVIAGYRILSKLGEGGMGVVLEAEQDNPRRRVALKVVRAGAVSTRTLRRFEHEAQVLGLLQHPGIAQIYEAGTFESSAGPQPFFAMELCAGRPLLDYLEELRPTARERLVLFRRICDAVDHAHRMGVIHRDLKPTNILVDQRGKPKILDFGVARLADSELATTTLQTREGQLVGTLPYMSPEQLSGDPGAIDTRSDVYSLGVLAYEMLTGRRPHDVAGKAVPEAARILSSEEPTTLSAVDQTLRGDVETIVHKALERDLDRRYESAAALARDVQRFLDDEPILAHPPSTVYQLRKFARRNRAFVGGVAAVFLVLVAGIVTAWVLRADALAQAGIARQEKETAQREAQEAEAAREFLQETLAQASPIEQSGEEPTLSQVLENALNRIDEAKSAHVEAAVRHTLGRVQSGFGKNKEAETHLRRSLAFYEQIHGKQHPKVAQVAGHLAGVLFRLGRHDEARQVAERVVAMQELLAGKHAITLAVGHRWVGEHQYLNGDFPEGERSFRASIACYESVEGSDSVNVAITKDALARLLNNSGKPKEAEKLFREALASLQSHAPRGPSTAVVMANLADLLDDHGSIDEAEKLQRESLAIRKERYGDAHQEVAVAMSSLGSILCKKRQTDEGLRMLGEAVDMLKQSLGEDHPRVAWSLETYAKELFFAGRLESAEQVGKEAVKRGTKTLGQNHNVTLRAVLTVGATIGRRGRLDEAAEMLEDCYTRMKEHTPWAKGYQSHARRALVGVMTSLGRMDRVQEILEEHVTAVTPGSPWDQWGRQQLAALHFRAGRGKAGRKALGAFVLAQTLKTRHGSVYIRTGGTGPDVLFLHGGDRRDKAFFEVEQALRKDGFRVTFVELPLQPPMVVDLLDSLGIDAATVVAHGDQREPARELQRTHAKRLHRIVEVNGAADVELSARIANELRAR